MSSLWQHFRYAVRALRSTPVFTAVAILSLALGIGANTAVFTLFDQVLLRLLPVQEPNRLVQLTGLNGLMGMFTGEHVYSYPNYQRLRDQNQVFSGLLGRFRTPLHVTHRGATNRLDAEIVTGNYFQVLGVGAFLGRLMQPADDRPEAAAVAVVSYDYWKTHWGGDRAVIGQPILVNNLPVTIVGVAAPGFRGLEGGLSTDVFIPVSLKGIATPGWDGRQEFFIYWLELFGRLKPGVTPQQAAANLNALQPGFMREDAQSRPRPIPATDLNSFLKRKLVLIPGQQGTAGLREQAQPLYLLMGVVALVLLIACTNIANLLLARAAARRKEISVRLALGARRGDIVAQLLVESLVLAFAGGALGLLCASWLAELAVRNLPFDGVLQSLSTTPDWRILAFTFCVTLVAGVLFGLSPAWQAAKQDVGLSLKENATNTSSTRSAVRFRKVLMTAQVMLSLLLLVGAGLFARSLYNLRAVDLGFQAERLVTFSLDASLNRYDAARVSRTYEQVRQQLAKLPGVEAVSASESRILSGDRNFITIEVEGYTPQRQRDMNPAFNSLFPGYFATLGVPVVKGREFTERDAPGAPPVVVVNEAFARFFFGQENPIGRRIKRPRMKGEPVTMEIVGVVRDNKTLGVRDRDTRVMYLPALQESELGQLAFYLRTARPLQDLAPQLRMEVRKIDANLPVYALNSLQLQLDMSLFFERAVAALSLFFGALATVLAALGLYGLMAYTVAQRTREIGIRLAIGAPRGPLLWIILKEVAAMTGLGLAMGVPAALALSRLVESQLFGVTPADPLTMVAAVLALGTLAGLAGAVPAWRATRIDPLRALRYE
jgi:predicted permease